MCVLVHVLVSVHAYVSVHSYLDMCTCIYSSAHTCEYVADGGDAMVVS